MLSRVYSVRFSRWLFLFSFVNLESTYLFNCYHLVKELLRFFRNSSRFPKRTQPPRISVARKRGLSYSTIFAVISYTCCYVLSSTPLESILPSSRFHEPRCYTSVGSPRLGAFFDISSFREPPTKNTITKNRPLLRRYVYEGSKVCSRCNRFGRFFYRKFRGTLSKSYPVTLWGTLG